MVLTLLPVGRAGGPWLVTDMRRGETMFELDVTAQEEVDRGIEEDGSNLSGVSARCSWSELNHLFTLGTGMSQNLQTQSIHSDDNVNYILKRIVFTQV